MSKKSNSKKIGECCEMTFAALQKWYSSEFEKLGWMILAENRGMNEKVNSYKTSLKYLLHSLELKMKDLKDVDKKHDLKLMIYNVDVLMKHVNKDFM